MEIQTIELNELPVGVKSQLLTGEDIYYFSYISLTGGCMSNESLQDHWVALTNKRLLYKSKVRESQNNTLQFIEKNGIIPFEKISFIEITKAETSPGCGFSGVMFYELRIGSSGGTTIIPIPSEEKGFEIRKIYMEVSEYLKNQGER